MNDFFESTIGKCFLYTLLCIFIFSASTLFGFFIAGDTNVFEWKSEGRFMIVSFSLVATGLVILIRG